MQLYVCRHSALDGDGSGDGNGEGDDDGFVMVVARVMDG